MSLGESVGLIILWIFLAVVAIFVLVTLFLPRGVVGLIRRRSVEA